MIKTVNSGLFLKLNLLLSSVIFCAFLFLESAYTPLSTLLTFMGALSSAAILYFLIFLITLPLSFNKKIKNITLALVFFFINLALIIDFFIYKIFHFHINAMVLNILTSPDAADSIDIGTAPVIAFIIAVGALIFFEYFLLKKLSKIRNQKEINSKLNKFLITPLIAIVIIEKISFGFAALLSKNSLIFHFKAIPLYQPLTFNRLANKLGFDAKKQAKYRIKTRSSLHYPIKKIEKGKALEQFNIFIIAFDSVRYDYINKEISPNIFAFSKDAVVFKHHYSGGDSTRFGIFSLFYGLNAVYWFSFLDANQKSVTFETLKQYDYKPYIVFSTNTNWPEFRKTCFVDIQNSIYDNFKGASWKKDKQSSAKFIDLIKNHNSSKKIFAFLFLDAPHGYSYPNFANKFGAPSEKLNYLAIKPNSAQLLAANKKYKNAIYYDDMLFGKIIKTIKDKGLYDNSLIIFTSDHGQEFYEYGNFGHNTSFSEAQIHIPFIVKLPKQLQEKVDISQINSSLTSHQDFIPSLFALLGVKTEPKFYGNGKNFFSKDFKREFIFSNNWTKSAILTKDTVTVFSNKPNQIFSTKVRDRESYKVLKEKKPDSKLIMQIMKENSKFLK